MFYSRHKLKLKTLLLVLKSHIVSLNFNYTASSLLVRVVRRFPLSLSHHHTQITTVRLSIRFASSRRFRGRSRRHKSEPHGARRFRLHAVLGISRVTDFAQDVERKREMASLVKRETMRTCLSCPLCDNILRDATTISECLHTCQFLLPLYLLHSNLSNLLSYSGILMIICLNSYISYLCLKQLWSLSSPRPVIESGSMLTKNVLTAQVSLWVSASFLFNSMDIFDDDKHLDAAYAISLT